jgi:membrane protein
MITIAIRVIIDAITQFMNGDGSALAARVALSMVMAVFPFLLFATSLAGFLGYHDHTTDIVDLVFEAWPSDIAKPIVEQVHAALIQRHPGFLSVGIALTVFFASNGVEVVRKALNRAYRIEETRSFLHRRVQSLLVVFFGAVLLVMLSFLLVITPYIAEIAESRLPNFGFYEVLWRISRFAFLIAALGSIILACHVWLPAGRRPFSEIWPGALGTLIAWVTTASLFAFYLRGFSHYSVMYAGLAGIITAQIFLYLMAAILILGGELNVALWRYRQPQLADSAPAEA